ncbi:534_t:CDS:2, partial [Paraglomus occultum]
GDAGTVDFSVFKENKRKLYLSSQKIKKRDYQKMIASLSQIFCQYLPISNTNSDDSDFDDNGKALQELKQDCVYHITGKFALMKDDIIEIIITTSKRLKLDTDIASIRKPK